MLRVKARNLGRTELAEGKARGKIGGAGLRKAARGPSLGRSCSYMRSWLGRISVGYLGGLVGYMRAVVGRIGRGGICAARGLGRRRLRGCGVWVLARDRRRRTARADAQQASRPVDSTTEARHLPTRCWHELPGAAGTLTASDAAVYTDSWAGWQSALEMSWEGAVDLK